MEGKNWGDTKSIQHNMFNGKNGRSFGGNFQRKKCSNATQGWPQWADVSTGMNPIVLDYQRKGGWQLFQKAAWSLLAKV